MLADMYALFVKAYIGLTDLTQHWVRNCQKMILKQVKFNRPEQNGLIAVKLSYTLP